MRRQDSIFKLLRNCMGFTVKQMADECQISAVYYGELERGTKKSPSPEVIQKIALTCNINTSTIYNLMQYSDIKSIRMYLIKSLDEYMIKQHQDDDIAM